MFLSLGAAWTSIVQLDVLTSEIPSAHEKSILINEGYRMHDGGVNYENRNCLSALVTPKTRGKSTFKQSQAWRSLIKLSLLQRKQQQKIMNVKFYPPPCSITVHWLSDIMTFTL